MKRDLLRAGHVVGMRERNRRCIAGWRDPFGVRREEGCDLAGVARRECLPGVEDDVFGGRMIHGVAFSEE
jgi:hypothetical protein